MNIPSNSDLTLTTLQESWKLLKAMAKAHTHEVDGAANTIVEEKAVNSISESGPNKLNILA